MLVHVVSLAGVVGVGSKDVMAVSRAWGHSFSCLRKLHFLRPISFSGTWSHPTFEPVVQQSPPSSRHVRFIAQAAALEDSSDEHQRRGLRLPRAERYALVVHFSLHFTSARFAQGSSRREASWCQCNSQRDRR